MLKFIRAISIPLIGFAALLIFLVPGPLAAQANSPFFYYYEGRRVPLTLDSSQILVRFKPGVSDTARRAVTSATQGIQSYDARVDEVPLSLSILPITPGADPLLAIENLKQHPEVQSAGRIFRFSDGGHYGETDEFIVRFKPSLPSMAIAMFNLANGVQVAREQPFSKGVLILRPMLGNLRPALDLANSYSESGNVDYAEPNFVVMEPRLPEMSLSAVAQSPVVPNDPDFSLQWSLQNTGLFQGSQPGADISAPTAWGLTTGGSQIKIAIIDEGVDATNQDLAGKVLTGYSALDGSSNTQPNPNDYHGTAVAGIAVANTNDAFGIAGVCWQCRILPVRVAYEDANHNWVTTPQQLATGIDWAWQNGADVLSNSWTMSAPSSNVTDAIVNARFGGRANYGTGSTVVFAAGNDDSGTIPFPASLNNYVIAVGASNWCDQRKTKSSNDCNHGDTSWGSNYGSLLDILAPGMLILTTCNGSSCNADLTHTYFSGTSASAPMVAGVIGLLYSLNPNLQPQDVQNALQSGAHDLPPAGRDNQSGFGRLDAYGALTALYDLQVSLRDNNHLAHAGDSVQFTANYGNIGLTAMSGTSLKITLPAGLTYITSNPTFTPAGGGVYQLSLGSVPRFATGSASITATVQPGTEGQALIVSAQIGGAFPQLNSSDDTAADTIGVISENLFLPFITR